MPREKGIPVKKSVSSSSKKEEEEEEGALLLPPYTEEQLLMPAYKDDGYVQIILSGNVEGDNILKVYYVPSNTITLGAHLMLKGLRCVSGDSFSIEGEKQEPEEIERECKKTWKRLLKKGEFHLDPEGDVAPIVVSILTDHWYGQGDDDEEEDDDSDEDGYETGSDGEGEDEGKEDTTKKGSKRKRDEEEEGDESRSSDEEEEEPRARKKRKEDDSPVSPKKHVFGSKFMGLFGCKDWGEGEKYSYNVVELRGQSSGQKRGSFVPLNKGSSPLSFPIKIVDVFSIVYQVDA